MEKGARVKSYVPTKHFVPRSSSLPLSLALTPSLFLSLKPHASAQAKGRAGRL